MTPQLNLPPEAVWGPQFDVARATDAYLATVPPAERARSDAYYEGGYWIDAIGMLLAVAIALALLRLRFAARLRNRLGARGRPMRASAIAAAFLAVFALLTLPWTLYVGYFREHAFGLSNHTLAGFLGEWAIGTAIGTGVGALAIGGIYMLVARVRERWIWWATAATFVFLLLLILVYPVFVAPVFNDYRPLPPGEVRDSILALAHDAAVPADDVFWFDASKQTKRIGANVAGLAGTIRIAFNDNLLNGTTLPEIRAVMGHEMGHYRLNHGIWITLGFAIAFGIAYWVINRAFTRLQRRHGTDWDVQDLADPAGLPLAFAIFAVVMYLLTPVTNTIVRTAEAQADAFGLDVAREPHGFASVAMRLSTYRKLEPTALEELIFFDHPSGRARVERAMRWLERHPPQ